MGLAVYRRAHKRRCSLWQPVRLPAGANWLVQASPLMTARKLAGDWEAAADDLLFRPSFRKTPEPGRPMIRERAKL
jgi:hypothetical protein